VKYTLKNIKSVQKKESLKKHLSNTVDLLRTIDLDSIYPDDYISPSGSTKKDFIRLIDRVSRCSDHGTIQHSTIASKITGEITDTFKMAESNRCNVYTMCPICASAKRARITEELRPYLETAKEIAGINFYMATITIENSIDAGQAYNHLRRSWTNFVKMGQRRDGATRSAGEAGKIIGSLLSIETVEGSEPGSYHVHGHALIVADEKIDYQVYDQDKRRELEKIYGNHIPDNELIKIAKDYEIINGSMVPLSKLTREWFISSGACNFYCKPIKEGFYKNKMYTIEDHLREIIKYECKPWELAPEKLLMLYDQLSGKRRVTKSGIFLKRNKKHWYRLIIKNNLKNFWRKVAIKYDIENDEEIEVLDRKIYSINYQDKNYVPTDTQDYSKYLIYKTAKKDYDTKRIVILNDYRRDFSALKKIIGTIPNMEWIDRKENIRDYFTRMNRKLKASFLFDLALRLT
jgi:hypothetical protein